jgi:hypothetical protein
MAMTNAECQAKFKERRKAQGFKRVDAWRNTAQKEMDQEKSGPQKAWEAEIHAEKMREARKEGRRLSLSKVKSSR